MKVKVSPFSRTLWRRYLTLVSGISVLASFFFVAVQVPNECRICVIIIIAAALLAGYLSIWIYANQSTSRSMNIDGSPLEVKVGDIFQEGELRAINFNEYFDTVVDDKLIARSSLNGVFINNHVADVAALDKAIAENQSLVKDGNESKRTTGKKIRYKLGSIHAYGDNLLVAFSKFNKNNMAELSMREYINCLMTFWNEIDRVYAGKSVAVPLMGAGITRFKDATVSEQELLDLLIWSFKISRVKFKYPAKVVIVISESVKDKINFYELKA